MALDPTAVANSVNNIWILLVSFLIFFMQPGFALLEAGQVRAKNAANVVMKNLMDWSLGLLSYFLLGSAVAVIAGLVTTGGAGLDLSTAFAFQGEASSWIGWLFGAVFAMTAATIVSGAVAGRMKFSAYVIFAVVLTAFIYPVIQGFAWGGNGLLSSAGFLGEAIGAGYKDFAGATVVHALGGTAGLTAAYMVGARSGRFDSDGNSQPIPGHSLIFAVLGTLILAFGWYGFNVGTQATVLSVAEDGTVSYMGGALGRVALTTTLAMGAGAVASTIVTAIQDKPDPLFAANGLLAGLVAITGACAHVTWWGGLIIGAIGGLQAPFVYRWVVDSLGIDDVCGVFAVHGSAGFIGTALIPFFWTEYWLGDAVINDVITQFAMQMTGIVVIGVWAVLATMVTLTIVRAIVGSLKVTPEEEAEGLDLGEHGISAYPEFGEGSGSPGAEAVADGGEVRTDGGEVRTDGGRSLNGGDNE
ncbi:ammonium transporter [Halorhabdus sp. BNX81]|uniref:ammonium transporter n=1 Tax=Halorhabdus sp. BNX81 TaxID=2980181 RepID=UPI0023DD1CD5|nr:ammonium transporter [Halorhabdus sp. BNX81]WEL20332.1 Ammonia permease [Halorhabdus sp. BNX81]